jgi:hypothetical protein
MKKLLFVRALPLPRQWPRSPRASAASIEFNLGDGYNGDDYGGPNYYRHRYADDYYRNYGMYDDSYRPRFKGTIANIVGPNRKAHWRHHHRVVEDVRVCRR